MKELIKETLKELEEKIGTGLVKFLVERIMQELSLCNPKLKGFEVPEDPKRMNFKGFSEKDLENFYYLLTELGGFLVGGDFKYQALSRLQTNSS